MKSIMKKMSMILVGVLLISTFTACAKFDASAYVKAILDNSYYNDATGILEQEVGTAEEAAKAVTSLTPGGNLGCRRFFALVDVAQFLPAGIPWNERQQSHSKKILEVFLCVTMVLAITAAGGLSSCWSCSAAAATTAACGAATTTDAAVAATTTAAAAK